jgi:hypothetical protein
MHHQKIKQKVINLRKQGYSYNYISKHTSITKSTISDWLHNVPFSPNNYTIKTIGNARIAAGVYKHQIKVSSLKKADAQAKKDIDLISKRDIMMLGLGIYIGEGGKTAGITRIINSDPKIIKFSIKWLKISFGVGIKNIRVRLFLYPDSDEKKSIKFWSNNTKIPENQFYKPTIDKRTNKKSSNNGKLPFGTAHMSVIGSEEKKFGVYLHRLIMAWINQIL